MPNFRFLKFTNNLSTDAPVYPTLVIVPSTRLNFPDDEKMTIAEEVGVRAVTDKPVTKGKTSDMIDLSAFIGGHGGVFKVEADSVGQVAIGVFVATLKGSQAQGTQDVTLLKAGKRHGHYEVTGTVTEPRVEWIGEDEDETT